jgi:hypothetical protein
VVCETAAPSVVTVQRTCNRRPNTHSLALVAMCPKAMNYCKATAIQSRLLEQRTLMNRTDDTLYNTCTLGVAVAPNGRAAVFASKLTGLSATAAASGAIATALPWLSPMEMVPASSAACVTTGSASERGAQLRWRQGGRLKIVFESTFSKINNSSFSNFNSVSFDFLISIHT